MVSENSEPRFFKNGELVAFVSSDFNDCIYFVGIKDFRLHAP